MLILVPIVPGCDERPGKWSNGGTLRGGDLHAHGTLFSAVDSLRKLLSRRCQAELFGAGLEFQLLSSGEMGEFGGESHVVLTVYRVLPSQVARCAAPERTPAVIGGRLKVVERRPPLRVDVHLLISIWTKSAQRDLDVLSWLMRTIEDGAVLDAAVLTPEGGWDPEERLAVVFDQVENEDLFRIWEAMSASYRVSAPYVIRGVPLRDARECEHAAVQEHDMRYRLHAHDVERGEG